MKIRNEVGPSNDSCGTPYLYTDSNTYVSFLSGKMPQLTTSVTRLTGV